MAKEGSQFAARERNVRSAPVNTGEPWPSLEVIVDLIGAATTRTGLDVYARLDERTYPKGIKISDAQLAAVNLKGKQFHPEWNYTIVRHEAP